MHEDISKLCLDDQFMILLHKKIMHKTGSAKRRAKKYYLDQYKKTGLIPKPLLLAAAGVMEGRKCSGRPRSLSPDVKNRFIEMLKASCDADDPRFIFITRKARAITTYHQFLQDEFQKDISIHALRRLVRKQQLDIYLNQPDFEQTQPEKGYFNPEKIFDLVQFRPGKKSEKLIEFLDILDGGFTHFVTVQSPPKYFYPAIGEGATPFLPRAIV